MGLENLQIVVLWAAFWTALFSFRRRDPGNAAALRFVLALGCGAGLAHLGWALLHLPRVCRHPAVLLDGSRGFTLLTVPLGVFLAVPWRRPRPARERFLATALRALPLAFAVAKLGCLAAGCCGGIPVNEKRLHPTAFYELAGFVLLGAALRGRSDPWVPAVFAFGFGAIRLVVEPLRATPPLGEPGIPVAVLAGAWLVASLLLTGGLVRRKKTRPSSAPRGTRVDP